MFELLLIYYIHHIAQLVVKVETYYIKCRFLFLAGAGQFINRSCFLSLFFFARIWSRSRWLQIFQYRYEINNICKGDGIPKWILLLLRGSGSCKTQAWSRGGGIRCISTSAFFFLTCKQTFFFLWWEKNASIIYCLRVKKQNKRVRNKKKMNYKLEDMAEINQR